MFGDLGWYKFALRAVYQVVSLLTRATDMDDSALLRKAMHVQRD